MADRFNPRGAPVAGPDPYEGWELVARNPFLPVGEYRNALGDIQAGFAAPSMVSEPARAFYDLIDTPAGTMPNPQNPEMQQNALTSLMSIYGGNAMSGMARGAGASRAMQALSDTSKPNPIGAGIAAQSDGHGISAYRGPSYEGPRQIEQVWGPKFDILMGQQYRIAEAGSDLSTMYDILSAKLSKASGIDPDMRAAMEAKRKAIFDEMDPEDRKLAGIFSDTSRPSLLGAGIAAQSDSPGIRYLDQMSRAAGEGTYNYVVRDDSLIDILKKYGLIPATYGAAQMLSEDDGYTTY